MNRAAAFGLVLAAGCVRRPVPPEPVPYPTTSVAAMTADSIANQLISRALTADAALANPDSVYSGDAEVVANGELRTEAPRLAGISPGGRLFLGSSRTTVTASFIWGSIEYRWVPDTPDRMATSGYATIIVGHLRDGSWRVVHLHSSTIPPPETPQPAHPGTSGSAGR
jgi:hypothetical protein